MIVDSSALLAVVLGELERERCLTHLLAERCSISAANLLEVTLVADSRSPAVGRAVDELLERLNIAVEPVTFAHAASARIAHRRFGRGSGSPARLNFGDCFAYALAASTGEPLLFVGEDFVHTDLLLADASDR